MKCEIISSSYFSILIQEFYFPHENDSKQSCCKQKKQKSVEIYAFKNVTFLMSFK